MATKLTSGRSSPPAEVDAHSTSNSPSRRLRMTLHALDGLDIECMPYRMPAFSGTRQVLRHLLGEVVTSTRSSRAALARISSIRSSIWPVTGRTSTLGSSRPVGGSPAPPPGPPAPAHRGRALPRQTPPGRSAPRTPRTSTVGCRTHRAGGSRTTRSPSKAWSPLYMARTWAGHVALVHEQQEVVREEVQQGHGASRRAGRR